MLKPSLDLTQFDPMTIRINDEGLLSAVRPRASRQSSDAERIEVRVPRIKVIDLEGNVGSPMMRPNSLDAIADQVQLLAMTQAKPCTREIECGSRQRIELERTCVEPRADVDVSDVEGDVVQFTDEHRRSLRRSFLQIPK